MINQTVIQTCQSLPLGTNTMLHQDITLENLIIESNVTWTSSFKDNEIQLNVSLKTLEPRISYSSILIAPPADESLNTAHQDIDTKVVLGVYRMYPHETRQMVPYRLYKPISTPWNRFLQHYVAYQLVLSWS